MIWIFYILRLVQSTCSYTDFDQFQLRSDNFYQEKSYVRGNEYAFGVWTQYAPQRKNYYLDKSNPNFDSSLIVDGFHILNLQIDGKIQTLFFQFPIYYTQQPVLAIMFNTMHGVAYYEIQYGDFIYEGCWIFTYFSFNSNKKYNYAQFNTANSAYYNFLQTNFGLKTLNTNSKLQHGGQGYYVIGPYGFHLKLFLGNFDNYYI
ncbi:unnamed protein product (macronuclear) [Paramecium tetraurelia]|uniref:Uncharacterized protein n=1 Tax=Paramecium tetraurelia TaxID=5888 RepID=A0CFJ1_PARTE|nr:uncharacterized protein GSPATT00037997001 [Paramecium tetraurelia]CAK69558.1 unnamed protein product [Paramecium tetraurelia]|eukprot:XP_001436955.1 hypothetical protein (macronuclear) [Paramecium tetraurelia strain d4-2]